MDIGVCVTPPPPEEVDGKHAQDDVVNTIQVGRIKAKPLSGQGRAVV
jgi:hypothetical protein